MIQVLSLLTIQQIRNSVSEDLGERWLTFPSDSGTLSGLTNDFSGILSKAKE